MDQSNEHIAPVIIRSLNGEASEKDRADLQQWIDQNPENKTFYEKLRKENFLTEEFQRFADNEMQTKTDTWKIVAARIAENPIDQSHRPARIIGFNKNYRRIAAAAALLFITAAIYYFRPNEKNNASRQTAKEITAPVTNILPASQGATLTLSDGTLVSLDTLGTGTLRRQNQATVIKSANGELKYITTGHTSKSKMAFNKLTTPKGKQFKLELPDGSKVWLNAGSSLEYPVAFDNNKREVKLEGEAYFEIAQDKQHPFFVTIADTTRKKDDELTIQVLGTHFNAMAYPNESKIQTTLLEGAVLLSKGKKTVRLLPGEAASTHWNNDQDFSVLNADIEKVMSWKNGMFIYNQTPLPEIMRDIERWYDVEVRYEGGIPDTKFDGYISRNNSLDKILTILNLNQVHFRIEGRTIIVSK